MKEKNGRFRVHQDNCKKAFSMTHGFCNEAMQLRLEKDTVYKKDVKGNPFKTLEMIKLKMCDPSKAKYPFVTLFKQIEQLVTTKQDDDEGTIECTQRFKQQQDNVDSTMGKNWLDTFIESTKEHIDAADSTEEQKLKDAGCESFMACVCLRNSNSNKHGSLKKNFQTQCALNNDQYPKTVSSVIDVLSSHQWDPAHKENQKQRKTNKARVGRTITQ